MSETVQWLIALVAAYLVGSIPFGLLIGLARGVDIRTQGSGNIGATNLGRVLSRRWGALCFVLDVLKGALPVSLLGWWLGLLDADPDPARAAGWMAIAAAGVLGHMFSIFLRFTGGKGVATGLGAMLGVWPHLTIAAMLSGLTWLIVIRICRYVSLSSIIAAATLPLWVVAMRAARVARSGQDLTMLDVWPFALGAALLALLVIFRHRANISRLRAGAEPRVRWTRPPAPNPPGA